MVIDNDPFIYDGDGIPLGMKTSRPRELTSEEIHDPVVQQILEVPEYPLELRRSTLLAFVSDWIADAVSRKEIERRLNIAGLNAREAEKLIDAVRFDRRLALVDKLERRFVQGLVVACLGTLMAVCSMDFFHFRFEGITIVGYLILLTIPGGLFIALHARLELRLLKNR